MHVTSLWKFVQETCVPSSWTSLEQVIMAYKPDSPNIFFRRKKDYLRTTCNRVITVIKKSSLIFYVLVSILIKSMEFPSEYTDILSKEVQYKI